MRSRVLIVSHKVPEPDQSSGELRLFTMLRQLLSVGADVCFCALQDPTRCSRTKWGIELSSSGVVIPDQAFDALVTSRRFDVIVFEFFNIAAKLMPTARAWQPSAVLVVDSVDVHFHRLRSKAQLTGSPADLAEADAVAALELQTYSRSDLVLTVSDTDSELLSAAGVTTPLMVIPNIHEIHDAPVPIQSHDPCKMIFVGNFRHEPNLDAVRYFCSEVMPLVRQHALGTTLRIVGFDPPASIRSLEATDISVVGFVEDITPVLLDSDISVAPLRFGGGIKGKIGEAMAHGLPVITSSVGAEGFGIRHEVEAAICDDPSSFALAVHRMVRDPDYRLRIAQAGHSFISRHYSTDAVQKRLKSFIERTQCVRPVALSPVRRLMGQLPLMYQRHLGWRFGSSS